MLAVVPTTGTGFTSFCVNHEIAMKPPKIRMYSALLTKMLKSILLSPQTDLFLG